MTRAAVRPQVDVRLDTVERAVADLAAGRAVIVMGDEASGSEGDIIFGASVATTELMAFTVRHTSGFICVALTEYQADRLDLPRMHAPTGLWSGPAYAVSVDAREGVGTGISAADRARTAQLLSSPSTTLDDLSRPGHVVTLRAQEGGVTTSATRTEAAVDLVQFAGLRPAAVICGVVSVRDHTLMACGDELREFADEHGMALISIADVVDYKQKLGETSRRKRRNLAHRGQK
jgi:3,4-dihydroxy 2-butanone 4-phosphate synthase/GTP cyclohydrolase II